MSLRFFWGQLVKRLAPIGMVAVGGSLHLSVAHAVSADEMDAVRTVFSDRCTALAGYSKLHTQIECVDKYATAGPALQLFDRLAAQAENDIQLRGITDDDARVTLGHLLSKERERLNASGEPASKPELTSLQRGEARGLRWCLDDRSALETEVYCLHNMFLSRSAPAFLQSFDQRAHGLLQEVRSKGISESDAQTELRRALTDLDGGPTAPQPHDTNPNPSEFLDRLDQNRQRRYVPQEPAPPPSSVGERFRQGLQAAAVAMQDAPLAPFKQKCRSFGFAEGTPEFAGCVQREYNAAQPGRPITCTTDPLFLTCEQ